MSAEMAVFESIQIAALAARRNPVLFVVLLAYGVVQVPSRLVGALDPQIAILVSLGFSAVYFFVGPFYFAGLIGMANEAVDGETAAGTFVAAGKKYYTPVLLVNLLLVVVAVVCLVVLSIGGVIGAAGFFAPLITTVAIIFFIQFFAHAIVVDDLGPLGGIRRSIRSVRHNLLSTIGYSVVVTAVFAIFYVAGNVASLFANPAFATLYGLPEVSFGVAVALTLALTIVSALVGCVMSTFSVAFYRSIRVAA
jgi:hypothetical protein